MTEKVVITEEEKWPKNRSVETSAESVGFQFHRGLFSSEKTGNVPRLIKRPPSHAGDSRFLFERHPKIPMSSLESFRNSYTGRLINPLLILLRI